MIEKSKYMKNGMVGGYRLVGRVGCGCSGEVWSAIDAATGGVAALKIYRGGEDVRPYAEYEYSAALRFRHANILRPLSMFEADGCPVIVLPYCQGRAVDGVAGYMSEFQIWRLLGDVSGALTEMHAGGYGHFDIQPSNILWTGRSFMLSDFGSCRPADGVPSRHAADDPSSFRFEAPEVSAGSYALPGDVWSLGATAFCLYMGTRVFNGLGGRAQHRDSPLPYMRKSMPELSELVCRCIDYEPSRRPSAAEVCRIAAENIARCEERNPVRRRMPDAGRSRAAADGADFWPERMNDGKQR